MLILAPNINTACYSSGSELAAHEAVFGDCAGYDDDSFLGNFAVAGHFGISAGHPDFRIQGASNHGTCLGCYVEGPDQPDLNAGWSMWLGGLGTQPSGSGLRLDGSVTNSLTVENKKDPANKVYVRMGEAANQGGTYFRLDHLGTGSAWPLRLKWNSSTGQYVEDIGNLGVGLVRTIEGTKGPSDDVYLLGQTTHYDLEIADTEWCPPEPVCQ